MPNVNLPPCFCDEDALGCDWTVKVTIEYSRPGHPESVSNCVPWELNNIPQLLAQALLQANVAAVNKTGLEVYSAWMQGCSAGDTPEELVARVREML